MKRTPVYPLPLLNFVHFLFRCIDTARLDTFRALCDLYKPSLSRDPSFEKYLLKIGVLFFGAQPPVPVGGGLMGGMFGDLFSRLFQGFDDDDDEQDGNRSGNGGDVGGHGRSAQTNELD